MGSPLLSLAMSCGAPSWVKKLPERPARQGVSCPPLPKNLGLKPRPNASGTATPRGRLYAILEQEARVVNLSKNPVAT